MCSSVLFARRQVDREPALVFEMAGDAFGMDKEISQDPEAQGEGGPVDFLNQQAPSDVNTPSPDRSDQLRPLWADACV